MLVHATGAGTRHAPTHTSNTAYLARALLDEFEAMRGLIVGAPYSSYNRAVHVRPSVVFVCLSIASCLCNRPARAADTPPATGSAAGIDDFRTGVKAYDALEYERAIALLTKAFDTSSESLTRDEKIQGLRVLAMAEFALGREDDTRAAFERLLAVDPAHQLDRKTPPRLRALLEETRAKIATQPHTPKPPPGLEAVVPTVYPQNPRADQSLRVDVPQPSHSANALTLYYRSSNERSFARATLAAPSGDHYAVTLPAASVHAPALEYYLVLLDAQGAPIAGAGTLADPLRVMVSPVPRPVYKRAWFWGVIGGVLAAGAVAAALGVTLAPHKPASVTIMPQ
jgi:tetratricopeptide (TPR) repeat protein